MKIAVLGTGAWGFALATVLAANQQDVYCWATDSALVERLQLGHEHPFLLGSHPIINMSFTTKLAEAVDGAHLIVEAVTSGGLRSVLEKLPPLACPLVITSKGIEQNSGKILPDVAIDVLGEKAQSKIAILSGPSFAAEVVRQLPTSVVAASTSEETLPLVAQAFASPYFRVYLSEDVRGVALGGALKNIIAIACGIADGLNLGHNAQAALITRGLHEMRRLAMAQGCQPQTLYGLSGLGDLCLTCSSPLSRNYRFGQMLAQGQSPEQSKDQIQMVVEGAYTSVSAYQLAQRLNLTLPISEMVYKIIYEKLDPKQAVVYLMHRALKEEHL